VLHLTYPFNPLTKRPTLASAAARDQHQAEGKKLLKKHAIAPSAARLCSAARADRGVHLIT
jgi:hypothetical protein